MKRIHIMAVIMGAATVMTAACIGRVLSRRERERGECGNEKRQRYRIELGELVLSFEYPAGYEEEDFHEFDSGINTALWKDEKLMEISFLTGMFAVYEHPVTSELYLAEEGLDWSMTRRHGILMRDYIRAMDTVPITITGESRRTFPAVSCSGRTGIISI